MEQYIIQVPDTSQLDLLQAFFNSKGVDHSDCGVFAKNSHSFPAYHRCDKEYRYLGWQCVHGFGYQDMFYQMYQSALLIHVFINPDQYPEYFI